MALLNPVERTFTTREGVEKVYILSHFPAIQGREIIAQYPISAAPKIGDYATNEAIMRKLMAFVAVPTDQGPLQLSTDALINNHVPDPMTLARIEAAMLEYNLGFSIAEGLSTLSNAFGTTLQAWISKTLMGLSAQSSQPGGRRSKS